MQRYIRAPEPFITRVEFVGGRFLYAVRVDTSQGFELCPADQCLAEAGADVIALDATARPHPEGSATDLIAAISARTRVPILADVAERHHLDDGDVHAAAMRPGDEIGELILVDALQRHRVDLDL